MWKIVETSFSLNRCSPRIWYWLTEFRLLHVHAKGQSNRVIQPHKLLQVAHYLFRKTHLKDGMLRLNTSTHVSSALVNSFSESALLLRGIVIGSYAPGFASNGKGTEGDVDSIRFPAGSSCRLSKLSTIAVASWSTGVSFDNVRPLNDRASAVGIVRSMETSPE